MNYACKSVIGRRRMNEDRCCAVSNARGSILLAVADGMGGHAAGEVASEMLIETLRTQAEHFAPLSLTEPALRNAILEANLSIYRAAEDSESCRSMGSTLVCTVIEGNRYLAANIGDSRLYLYSADRLTRITKDHSLVQTFMDEGSITPDEAAVHPLRNVITRAVGTNLTVEPDLFCGALHEDDMLLLCSDGLHGSLSDMEISAILSGGGALEPLCDSLIDAASNAGSSDNISVVLARCTGVQNI